MALHRLIALLVGSAVLGGAAASAQTLPERTIVGFWHNWTFPSGLRLTETDRAYDVVNIAFAVPSEPDGSTMVFAPDPGIYPRPADFIADVRALQAEGRRVLISIGGAADPVRIESPEDADAFVMSMLGIIETYGFDGMDIDLEGQSLFLEQGDDDFHDPRTPRIVYFIRAVDELLDRAGPGFVLTASPETAFVQGGFGAYGGVWGAYLPVIHALRDRLTLVHVQHYNTGSMFGRDGRIYEPATADFHVAMAEMMITGFPVAFGRGGFFPGLRPDQVAIGLPASPRAAGSGYTPPAVVERALRYLYLGESFGGTYELAEPGGYPCFRGLMTWSINWDEDNGGEFAGAYRPLLDDALGRCGSCAADLNNDGLVDGGDFLAFLGAFFAGDDAGDFNRDGRIDGGDFLAFLGAFFQGC